MSRPHAEVAQRVEVVERLTGHHFHDVDQLCNALTHSSYAHERDVGHYERLEFLGDAVLNLHATLQLAAAHPDAAEGDLTALRQRVIETSRLGARARELGIDALVWRGNSERSGPPRDDLLGDVLEALFAVLFSEGGFAATVPFAELVLPPLVAAASVGPTLNPINRLQELTQADGGITPDYRFSQTGPSHAPAHTAVVSVGARELATGYGRSKADARRNAAELALAILTREDDAPVADVPQESES